MKDNLSGDKVALRDRFTERAQDGQRVSVRLPVDNQGVGNVLAEKRGDVWAVICKFGFTPVLCAVRPGLLGVRRADRDVEGGARVAEGRGEDVGGPEVSARNDAGSSAVQSQD